MILDQEEQRNFDEKVKQEEKDRKTPASKFDLNQVSAKLEGKINMNMALTVIVPAGIKISEIIDGKKS